MAQTNQRGTSKRKTIVAGLALLLGLAGCQEPPPVALGVLASDRIELVVDISEPIVEILVAEEEQIFAGQLLVVLAGKFLCPNHRSMISLSPLKK